MRKEEQTEEKKVETVHTAEADDGSPMEDLSDSKTADCNYCSFFFGKK